MPTTSVRATFYMSEPEIQNDAVPITTSNSVFANISKLGEIRKKYNPFITLEHNVNILDGSLEHFDLEESDLSYFSKTLSQDNLETNNEISINFSKLYSTNGISIDFGVDSFLGDIEIIYLRNNEVISNYIFTPNFSEESFTYGGTNFNKIIFKFKTTKFPRMFSRLQYLIYGKVYNWLSSDIISCNVVEKIHPISKEVQINTCELSIYSSEDIFNMLDESSDFKYLRKNQKFKIFSQIDGKEYEFGTFFLDTWDTTNTNISTFKLISPLGLLSNSTFYDGWFCLNPLPDRAGYTTYSAINKILDILNLNTKVDFNISEELNTPLFGIIPFGDYKSVLQTISFCSCAMIDDTRDGVIKIKNILGIDSEKTITLNQMFDKVIIHKNELPSTLELHYNLVELHSEDEVQYDTLFEGYINTGNSQPIYSTQALEYVRYKKDGEETWNMISRNNDDSLYYINFTAPSDGKYIIQASKYVVNKENFKIFDISNLQYSNQSENRIKIENEPLIFHGVDDEYSNDIEFINKIKTYYNSVPFMAEFQFINIENIKTGDLVTIETELNKKLKGYIIEQSINLSGGMISKAKLIGDSIDES